MDTIKGESVVKDAAGKSPETMLAMIKTAEVGWE
jgi:hypothetical protein